jgi:DNA-binding beta-propeller fold protein YncE
VIIDIGGILLCTRFPIDINLNYSVDQIALHPDGKDLFVLHKDDGAISVIDMDSSTVNLFDNLSDVKDPWDIQFTSDGRKAYVAEMYNNGFLGGIVVLDVVPEPSTLVLLVAGGISLLAYEWRRRRHAA